MTIPERLLGPEADTGEADIHILHPMSTAFVRNTDIHLVRKIMPYSGHQLMLVRASIQLLLSPLPHF